MKQKIGRWLPIAVVLQVGMLAASAQTYLFTGSETTVTLNPGAYDITAYGAVGGSAYYEQGHFPSGGFGAEMEGQFYFAEVETLTILVGGVGSNGGPTPSDYINNAGGGGGGGGSFVVNGSTPLVVAGGGGGGGYDSAGSSGLGTSGGGSGGSGGSAFIAGGGGGFYSSGGSGSYDNGTLSGLGGNGFNGGGGGGGGGSSSGGGNGGFGGGGGGAYLCGGGGGGYNGGGGGYFDGGGGGGGSYIDSSAVANLAEVSGVLSPDDSPNGEIIITEVPEPTSLALAGLGGFSLLLLRRKAPSCLLMLPNNTLQPTPGGAAVCNSRLSPGVPELWR